MLLPEPVENRSSSPRGQKTLSQKTLTALVLGAERVRRGVAGALATSGISLQQYQVLRILRSAHPEPLAAREIVDQMVEKAPGITRLLDGLDAAGLARRARSDDDRRLMRCWITGEGLALLARLDPVVDQAGDTTLRALSEAERATLLSLLERLDGAVPPFQSPESP